MRRGAAPPLEESLLLVEVNRLDAEPAAAGEPRRGAHAAAQGARRACRPTTPLALRGDLGGRRRAVDRADGVRARARRPPGHRARRGRTRRWRGRGSRRSRPRAAGTPASTSATSARTSASRPERDHGPRRHAPDPGRLPLLRRRRDDHAARAQPEPGQHRGRAGRDRGRRAPRGAGRSSTVRQEVAAAFTQYEAARRSLAIYARGVRDVARAEPRRRAPELRRSGRGYAARRDRRAAALHRDRDGLHGGAEAGLRRGGRDRAGGRTRR